MKADTKFNSLTEIMEYFYTVPFEEFKTELNKWFKTELAEKRQQANSDEKVLPDNFDEFIHHIFKLAEEKDQQRLN